MSNTLDNSQPDHDFLEIEIIFDQDVHFPIDEHSLRLAATSSAAFRGYVRGEIGIRVSNDAGIHEINRKHLGHDYPTDVISFAYHAQGTTIQGELVVSVDTARRRAAELGWPEAHELLLYVVHGTLHLAGMDDRSANERAQMRDAEREIMVQLGIDDIVRCGADQTGRSLLEGHA